MAVAAERECVAVVAERESVAVAAERERAWLLLLWGKECGCCL